MPEGVGRVQRDAGGAAPGTRRPGAHLAVVAKYGNGIGSGPSRRTGDTFGEVPMRSRTPAARCTMFVALLLVPAHAWANPDVPAAPARARIVDVARRMDVNRVNLLLANDGRFPFEPDGNTAGTLYPRGSAISLLYASGLWLGGTVDGQVHVTVAEYESEFAPGGMPGGIPDDPFAPEHVVYKVARWGGSPQDTAHVVRTAAELATDPKLDPLAHHSWSEYMAGAVPHGAPWRLHRLPDSSTPAAGDSVDVPGPDLPGEVATWCVFNDANVLRHVAAPGSTAPLGVEVRQTVFAYDRPGPLGNTAFVRYEVFNRGGNVIPDLRMGFWSDPDVGASFSDDLAGCDTTRSLGYAYSTLWGRDPAHGFAGPAIGFDMLSEHDSPELLRPSGLDAFVEYVNGADPSSAEESWNLMRGLKADGSAYLDSLLLRASPFFYAGDPLRRWTGFDKVPSNNKTLATAGPWAFAPGDSLTLWVAIVVGQGETQAASLRALRCASDDVQDVFDSGFVEPFVAPRDCPQPAPDCPRTADWWTAHSAALSQFSAAQWSDIAVWADTVSPVLFSFAGSPPSTAYAAALAATATARDSARREYLAAISNFVAGDLLDLVPADGRAARLGPETGVRVTPLGGGTVAELFVPSPVGQPRTSSAEALLVALESAAPGDPQAAALHRQLAGSLHELNSGFGIGSVCVRAAPFEVTLLEASVVDAHVRLRWRLGEPATLARLERLNEFGTWLDAGATELEPGGTALAEFDLFDSGRRAFRLAAATAIGIARSDSVWIDAPSSATPALAMTGVWPNPSNGDVRVSFTLPSGGAARLEVYDLGGRRAYARELGALAAGLHHVEITPGGALRPGVYFVVLRFGGERRTARFVAL